jgi:hypothetical protein
MTTKSKKQSIVGKIVAVALLVWLTSIVLSARETATRRSTGVLVTGVHHMGTNYEVLRFFLDGFEFGDAGREGGGGGNICCVSLPEEWKPGLAVELRWEVADWSTVDPDQVKENNYASTRRAYYRARVPIEKYQRADHLWVHFFSDGKARLISSVLPPENPLHPAADSDMGAANSAIKGQAIVELFTQSEMDQIIRRIDASEKNRSTWK